MSEIIDIYKRRQVVDDARSRKFAASDAVCNAGYQAERMKREADALVESAKEYHDQTIREYEIAVKLFNMACAANHHREPDGTFAFLMHNGWGTCKICGQTATAEDMKMWREANPETPL